MDEDWYVAEKMIQARVTEAQARARVAALFSESNECSGSKSLGTRLAALGRSLVHKLWWEFPKAHARRVGRHS